MSHMWFGDLVTMKWWDDLWLNESFAEYMSHRCLVDATEYTDAWVDSSIVRKVWGYGAERSPSTHPVAGVEALDAQSALQNFDGISYAKGAAALRQLIAYVGDDQFIAGVRAYLTDKSYGNGTLADFLGAIETRERHGPRARGRAHGCSPPTATRSRSTSRSRTASSRPPSCCARRPADRPADRPHAFDVAGWTDGRRAVTGRRHGGGGRDPARRLGRQRTPCVPRAQLERPDLGAGAPRRRHARRRCRSSSAGSPTPRPGR